MSDTLIVRCENCGANNRVLQKKLEAGVEPVCARCKQILSLRPHPVVVTDATFAEEVERAPLPVLVDMWAPWCRPCRKLGPVVEALSVELVGRIRVAKLNLDDNPVTAGRFPLPNIPALLVFRDGREIDRIIGVPLRNEILHRLQQIIAA